MNYSKDLNLALIHIFEDVKKTINSNLDYVNLKEKIKSIGNNLGFNLTNYEIELIEFYLEQEKNKFGVISKLIDQQDINDIIIKSYDNIVIQIGRKNIRSTVKFPSLSSYEKFIEKILSTSGQQLTIKTPIVDCIVDNCRFNFVHSSLTLSEHYSTIRISRFKQISIHDLVKKGMLPSLMVKYLEVLINAGKNIIVVGEVGAGKTTLARALLESIPNYESILVIEDTPEIELEHPNVRYIRTRVSNNDGFGEIKISECIKAGMRMAMNRLIVGEIRDPLSAQSFIEVSSSGHPGISTLHAGNSKEALTRLENFIARSEVGLSEQAIKSMLGISIQIIITVSYCYKSNQRKIFEIAEVNGCSEGHVRISKLLTYNDKNCHWNLEKKQSFFQQDLINSSFSFSEIDEVLN